MSEQIAKKVYPRDVDKRETRIIVEKIRKKCGLKDLSLGYGAYLVPPKLGDYEAEGYKILIDSWILPPLMEQRIEHYVKELGLESKVTRREAGSYLMVYKPIM